MNAEPERGDDPAKETLIRRGAAAYQRAQAMSRAERRATERRIRALQARARREANRGRRG